jgi:hypothetical protein
MKRVLGWAVSLLGAWLLSACATADVTGQRSGTAAPAVALKSVDVVLVDRAGMKKSGLSALRFDSPADATLMAKAGNDLRQAMSEVRDGVVAALAAHGIPGRAYLASFRDSQATSSATHMVIVSMRSATNSPNSPTKLTLNVEVFEVATQQSLWKGSSELYPGGDGFSKEARAKAILEKRQRFGESVVRALQDSGVLVGMAGSAK